MAETEADTGSETGDTGSETGDTDAPKSTQLPKWRSHKEVNADRIDSIERFEPRDPGEAGMKLHLNCGQVINVPQDLIARGQPAVGDYYVVYNDGYASWSPGAAFEEGYTSI